MITRSGIYEKINVAGDTLIRINYLLTINHSRYVRSLFINYSLIIY